MNNKSISFLIFVLGAVIGSVATWQYIKKKYQENNSAADEFSVEESDDTDENYNADVRTKANQAKEKPGIVEYATKLHNHGYTNYSAMSGEDKKEEETKPMTAPYIITPEEFGELDEYEQFSLTYYADQVLTDDNDDLIDDVEDVVGFESLTHFGEYEDDSVFVRNDRLKCDYEILLDQRNYSDVVKTKPPKF